MMGQKYLLQELLKEEQEPFLLNKYISDRRRQIKRPSQNTSLQLKKRKPLHQPPNTTFPVNLCKNASCLFSFNPNTPKHFTKSPLFELASPAKTPCKSPNTIFLHIPSRTAALLLEAALRIQKQSTSSSTSKTKAQNTSNGFGVLGSLFKRLTQRKREIECATASVSSVKDVLSRKKQEKLVSQRDREEINKNNSNLGNGNVCEVGGFRCSSSAVWSESNEDKSLDMETSSSASSGHYDEEIIDFVTNQKHDAECSCCHHHDDDDNSFCESPFRFVLQRSPSFSSSGRNTPELPSPEPSPSRHRKQDKESKGDESLNKFQSGEEEEEEEDKEQCSPVSVLDPPFADDDEGHGNDDDYNEEHGFDLECSYAIVQRAKQQLLYKLRRFEKLAGLDPVELEKTMLDQLEDEDETFMEGDDYEDVDSEASSCMGNDFREQIFEALCNSSVHDTLQIPEGLKKLVSDLIVEEEKELSCLEDRDMVVTRVRRRLELWKEVESNTIDMMIEEDFSREDGGWKKNVDQIRDMAGELELAIFGFLVEEFSEELEC